MSDDKMSRFMARDPISAAMQVLHDDIMSRESLDEPTTSTSPVAVSEVHTLLL